MKEGDKKFEFDRVYGDTDDSTAVFKEISPMLLSLLDGYLFFFSPKKILALQKWRKIMMRNSSGGRQQKKKKATITEIRKIFTFETNDTANINNSAKLLSQRNTTQNPHRLTHTLNISRQLQRHCDGIRPDRQRQNIHHAGPFKWPRRAITDRPRSSLCHWDFPADGDQGEPMSSSTSFFFCIFLPLLVLFCFSLFVDLWF